METRINNFLLRFATAMLLLITLSPVTSVAEILFGGEGELTGHVMINTEVTPVTELFYESTLAPRLSVWSTSYEFTADGLIGFDSVSGAMSFDLPSYYIGLYLFDVLQLSAGRFPYLPGSAELLSNTNFTARTDYEQLFAGSIDDVSVANDIVQLVAFFGDFYFKASFLPLRKDYILPSTDSPWFPGKDIPTSLDIQILLSTSTIILDKLYYTTQDFPAVPEDFGGTAEVGGTFAGIDLSLLYYYGYDYTPLLAAEFIPHGLYDSDPFDIALTPAYSKIHAVGFNASTNIGAFRLWTDSAYIINKSFAAQRITFFNRTTPIVSLPYLAATAGFSYEFSAVPILAMVEGRYSHVYGGSEHVIAPTLSTAVVALVDASFFEHRLRAQAAAIYSFVDSSTGVFSAIRFQPSDELSVEVTYPLFLGAADTELGQFGKNHYITATLRWGF